MNPTPTTASWEEEFDLNIPPPSTNPGVAAAEEAMHERDRIFIRSLFEQQRKELVETVKNLRYTGRERHKLCFEMARHDFLCALALLKT